MRYNYSEVVAVGLLKDETDTETVNIYCATCGHGWHNTKKTNRIVTLRCRADAVQHVEDKHWPQVERAFRLVV